MLAVRLISSPKTLVFRHIHSSALLAARHVEVVPALGESITEGTIAKWTKNVGDKVGIDEVVVVVETDKVTVDIKSTMNGILTKQLATENVSVGHPLFELETDMTANVGAAAQAPKAAAPAAVSSHAAAPSKSDNHHGQRVPLIKFIGKRSKVQHHNHSPTHSTAPAPKVASAPSPAPAANKKPTGPSIDFMSLKGGAWYGRPKLSAYEINAIDSGGATLL